MKNSVLKLINELIDEDMTLIVVSHEDEFVNKVSDRIFSFNKNTLLEKKNE